MRNIEEMLKGSKTIAVVGLSPNPERDSYRVAKYLQEQGYRIIPVNPGVEEVLGEKCYPSLTAIPERVDMVDVFRRTEFVPPLVEEAIQIGAKVVWMQDDIVHEEAAQKAREAGLDVVMDRWTLRDHQALVRAGKIHKA